MHPVGRPCTGCRPAPVRRASGWRPWGGGSRGSAAPRSHHDPHHVVLGHPVLFWYSVQPDHLAGLDRIALERVVPAAGRPGPGRPGSTSLRSRTGSSCPGGRATVAWARPRGPVVPLERHSVAPVRPAGGVLLGRDGPEVARRGRRPSRPTPRCRGPRRGSGRCKDSRSVMSTSCRWVDRDHAAADRRRPVPRVSE